MDLFLKTFCKITLENEFNKKKTFCKKWENNIKIYVFFQEYIEQLDFELESIINEINSMSDTIKLIRINNKNDANLEIFLCSHKMYKKISPKSQWDKIDNNYGLVTIFFDKKFVINRATLYVDIYRTKKLKCQKHLLREELTQSLGLINDIYMDNSIFNQKWECTDNYTYFDKLIIKFFLSKHIKPGMNQEDIQKAYSFFDL